MKVDELINEECRGLAALLIAKNKDYNNTALAPHAFFSNLPAEERLRVRIDDKITRLVHLFNDSSEPNFESIMDNILDLTGYFVLWRIAKRLEEESSPTKASTHYSSISPQISSFK